MATLPKIKRNDTVRVLRGKDAGKRAKVLAVLPKEERVVVEGLNMVKKHVKARTGGQKGQRVSIAAPLRLANVQLICSQCKKGTRVGITRENGVRQRVCKQCKSVIE
jgi:large subunit ribosomal protein L24